MYANDDGTEADALKILHDHGLNYARIRLWVESPDSYHGKTQLLELAKRIEKNKIKLLVDFHYADSWADPGKQPKPAAWENLDFEGLKKALYDHTFDICSSLKDQGTPPDMAQIGNEINNGTLWPDVPGNGWDPSVHLPETTGRTRRCSISTIAPYLQCSFLTDHRDYLPSTLHGDSIVGSMRVAP